MSKHDETAQETQAAGLEDQRQDGQVQGLAEYNAEVLAKHPGMVQAFLALLQDVPEPDSEDATASIVATILEATTLEELDRPWDSDGMRKHFNEVIRVNSITRRPSDYTGGLGVYLGCHCTWPASGENVFLSCGSVSAVVQLVKAHALGLLPALVMPVPAKKATKDGYWPYHLTFGHQAEQ